MSVKTDSGTGRTAIIGIGNELNGDDAAGVLVARRLKGKIAQREDLLIIEGATAPENFTGVLRRFQPERVLLIDCAAMDQPPGTIAWLERGEIDGMSASTHTLPPTVLAAYLIQEMNCAVGLLAIQPGTTGFDAPMTPAVAAAVERVTEEVVKIF